MMTSAEENGPAERSKEMLLRHPPLIVREAANGAVNYTLPALVGFNGEEVELFLLMVLLGKAMAEADRRGVPVDTLPRVPLPAAEAAAALEWAFAARWGVVLYELVSRCKETKYARRFWKRVRACHNKDGEKRLREAACEVQRTAASWSEVEWHSFALESLTSGTLLQFILHQCVVPVFGGPEPRFGFTEKGRTLLDGLPSEEPAGLQAAAALAARLEEEEPLWPR